LYKLHVFIKISLIKKLNNDAYTRQIIVTKENVVTKELIINRSKKLCLKHKVL